MALDPEFAENRELVDEHDGHEVWGPVDEPEQLGIHGTHVAVDFDICLADGACLERGETPSSPSARPRRSSSRPTTSAT